jgi:hypothetical protein
MKKLLLLLLVGLFATFVWPTRYEQYAPGESPYAEQVGDDAPVRVNRLTGDITVQDASGAWRTVGNTRKALAFERPVVDPNATRRPSARHHQDVADQQRRSVEQTQQAVEDATQH